MKAELGLFEWGSAMVTPGEVETSNTSPPMKPLALSRTGAHGQFDQIYRFEDLAIFEQRRNAILIGFEVVIVQKIPGRENFGKVCPAHEAYPPLGKEWSPNGWSFSRQKRHVAVFVGRLGYRPAGHSNGNQ